MPRRDAKAFTAALAATLVIMQIKARLAALDPTFDTDFWNRVDAADDDAARYGARR